MLMRWEVAMMIKVINNEMFISDDAKIRINEKLYTTDQVCEAMKGYNKIDRSVLQKALNKYGAKQQEDICIEELSELQLAILRLRRVCNNTRKGNVIEARANLIEEIADVEICIEYLKLINEQTNPDFRDKIEKAIEYKLRRLKDRMEKKQ